MSKIKICGMHRKEDIEYCNIAKPDYIGFIFLEGYYCYITEEKAAEYRSLLAPGIKAVGVFVDAPIEQVKRIVKAGTIDVIQLHGHESEEYIKELHDFTDKPIINAAGVSTPEDVEKMVKTCADYILFDNGAGGTGKSFDWNLIKDVKRPYFLAGGLNPSNLAEAIEAVHPFAVDMCSGAETDKVKDLDKMVKLVSIARK